MKMDILEGFSLALLTQLNAYSIITKGKKKRMFSGKKTYNPNTKSLHGTQTNYTRFCKLFMVELAALLKQVRDQVVDVHKSRILPRSLIFNLRESNRKSCCLLHRALALKLTWSDIILKMSLSLKDKLKRMLGHV